MTNIIPIINLINRPKNATTVASIFISQFLESIIDGGKLYFAGEFDECPVGTSHCLFVNSSGAGYCGKDNIWKACRIMHHAEKSIYVQNDFKLPIISQVFQYPRKNNLPEKKLIHWSSVDRDNGKRQEARYYINWNVLSLMRPDYQDIDVTKPRSKDVVYYGALRRNRLQDFRKYFGAPADKKIDWSLTTKKSDEQYLGANIIPKFKNLMSELTQYKATLYLEDDESHKVFMSPANRFYESIVAGCAILFDEACVNTFAKIGLDITPFTVSGPEDLWIKFQIIDEILEAQKLLFTPEKYIGEFSAQLMSAASACGISLNII